MKNWNCFEKIEKLCVPVLLNHIQSPSSISCCKLNNNSKTINLSKNILTRNNNSILHRFYRKISKQKIRIVHPQLNTDWFFRSRSAFHSECCCCCCCRPSDFVHFVMVEMATSFHNSKRILNRRGSYAITNSIDDRSDESFVLRKKCLGSLMNPF